jgi:myo-inositol-1-phosphate synthase
MEKMVPMRSVYYPDFIAGNQRDRADNVLPGNDKAAHLAQLRSDIRTFKVGWIYSELDIDYRCASGRF